MATKTTRKKAPKRAETKPKAGDQVTIAPDYSRQFPTFYANFALVNHSRTDITIDLCLLAPPYQVKAGEKFVALVPPVARIVLPPSMIDGLVRALREQEARYKQEADGEQVIIPLG